MKTARIFASFALAASLFLTPSSATAQATALAGKSVPSKVPSVPGGAPINVAVYNYLSSPAIPYWVTPAGVLQPVPGAGPVAPMSGSTPTILPSFRDATLVFRGVNGGGHGKHFGGNDPAPFIVLGNPPPGAALPPGYKKGGGATAAASNPPAAAPETPAASGKGRKRIVNKAPDVNVTINTPPPGAPAAEAPAPAAPVSPAADAKSDEPEGDFKTLTADDPRVVEFMRIHNAARAAVGVSPLEWSDDLAFTAQDWADRIGRNGKIRHRPKSEYGENIGWGTGDYTAASAANAWLAEKAKYSPDAAAKTAPKKNFKSAAKAAAADETAHYTQMVWGKSTMAGFGIATTKDGQTVVVANYNPPGNVEGEKPYGN